MIKALHSKLRYAFDTWKLNHQKDKIVYEINTEGDVAVEAERSRRRVLILKKFLSENGHPVEEVEEELTKKRETQLGTMKSFIIRMFFQMSDFSVIPKAFNQLRAYTKTKKLYKTAFKTCHKYMNSDIYWAFKRWKHHHEDARKYLQSLSKSQLIHSVCKNEHILGSLQYQQESKNNYINFQLSERQKLLINFASGQKIAFQRCEYKLRYRPMRKFFTKWQKYTYDCKISESNSQILKTEEIIAELLKLCQNAEQRNKDLLLENEELRQASLDGIEIAKAVQELTKEREKLSSDLNEKNMTIQQLLNDNNAMSHKLN